MYSLQFITQTRTISWITPFTALTHLLFTVALRPAATFLVRHSSDNGRGRRPVVPLGLDIGRSVPF